MSELTWSLKDLLHFTESKEPEVRYWAVDRLVRHFPKECCDTIAQFLLDAHDATPPLVARHLREYGSEEHHPILVKGFRLLRGMTPGYCLQALAALGYSDVVPLATDALKRGDLSEPARALILEALAELGTAEARDTVRDYVARKVEILVEPAALRAALRVAESEEIPETLGRLLMALQWKGTHRAGEAFRTLMDALQLDDAGWCFRTGPSGHIELRKTIKAVESGYDCDISATLGETRIKLIAQKFRAGNLSDVVRAIADWTVEAAEQRTSPRAHRIAAVVRALSAPAVLEDLTRMGHQVEQWLLGFQLSAAFAVARFQDPIPTVAESAGDLEQLLQLAELETAFHLPELPAAIAATCESDEHLGHRAQEWCLRMLEAKGPFFPRVVALATLGELRAIHFIPEVMEYLSEENSYVYGTAERALSKMGEGIVPKAAARIDSGMLDPDAAHSLLVLLCDLGTEAAYQVVARHLDWFMETVGPGTTAEWVSLFGTEELIEPLRDWLEEDPLMVGQALLLLGAMHDVRIPEEEEILKAIEDERARQAEGQEAEGNWDGEGDDGDYVM